MEDYPSKLLKIAARGRKIVIDCIMAEPPNRMHPKHPFFFYEYGYMGFEVAVPNIIGFEPNDIREIQE